MEDILCTHNDIALINDLTKIHKNILGRCVGVAGTQCETTIAQPWQEINV